MINMFFLRGFSPDSEYHTDDHPKIEGQLQHIKTTVRKDVKTQCIQYIMSITVSLIHPLIILNANPFPLPTTSIISIKREWGMIGIIRLELMSTQFQWLL